MRAPKESRGLVLVGTQTVQYRIVVQCQGSRPDYGFRCMGRVAKHQNPNRSEPRVLLSRVVINHTVQQVEKTEAFEEAPVVLWGIDMDGLAGGAWRKGDLLAISFLERLRTSLPVTHASCSVVCMCMYVRLRWRLVSALHRQKLAAYSSTTSQPYSSAGPKSPQGMHDAPWRGVRTIRDG